MSETGLLELLDREAVTRRLDYASVKSLDKVRERSPGEGTMCRHEIARARAAAKEQGRKFDAKAIVRGPCRFPEPAAYVATRSPLWRPEDIDRFGAEHPRRGAPAEVAAA